jgi:CTP:molybdopterin cytidylyltransferase MocA
MQVPAIILAAGASRRLGQPKQLVQIAGETLLARTIRIVGESGADPVFVVLGAHREIIAANVDLSHIHPAYNPLWEQGIASSIHAGMTALHEFDPEAKAALLLVCDQPRLTAEHLRSLIRAYEQTVEPAIVGCMIVASQYAGIAGIPAIFPASQFASLMALQGDAGAKILLQGPALSRVALPFAGGEIDVDTPSDLPL